MISLAVKYRPTTFSDVVEQGSIKAILEQQLKTNQVQHSYLFCGGAGTGKTTTARIFANEINQGQGSPVEIDAASNNSVNDVRNIIQQSRMATLDGSRYRVYIIDECHSLSGAGWQAMLKLLEEPPETAIFIFCTTDPQKIPHTILSRIQRYDFQRISQQGVVDRLYKIMEMENHWESDIIRDIYAPLEYIAKLADGGMRDAITMLDKCLAYSETLTVENVVTAIGTVDFDTMLELTDNLVTGNPEKMITIIDGLHNQGKDLKVFIRNYTSFILDMCKYNVMGNLNLTQIPSYYEETLKKHSKEYYQYCQKLLKLLLRLNSDIKWDTSPKAMIEANLYNFCIGDETNE